MKLCKMLLAGLLAVMMLVGLCACTGGGTSNDGGTTTTNGTTTTTTKADDGKVTYTVTVKDQDGNPVSGAMVQICKETCMPTLTDANGVATWSMAEDEYKVSFAMTPEGYTVEENYYFEDDATSMEITITKN